MRTCFVVRLLASFSVLLTPLLASLPAASAAASAPGVTLARPVLSRQVAIRRDTVRIKAVLTHVDCLAESQWDRFSDSDETCVIVTGFRHPGAQTGSSGYRIFSDVDSGESRTVPANVNMAIPPASGYIAQGTSGGVIPTHAAGEDVSRVELNPGDLVGFDVRILEHDDANEADITGSIAGMTEDMANSLHGLPSILGDIAGFLGDIVNGFAQAFAALADIILGSGDDYVGGHTVAFYRPSGGSAPALPDLGAGAEVISIDEIAQGDSEMYFFVDGGSEGLYMVFYRVTKEVIPAAGVTVVQGQATPVQPSGQQAAPITVQGEPVAQEPGTVQQVSPRTSGGTRELTRGAGGTAAGGGSVVPLGARADRIVPEDFLGDYRLYLDGIPYRLHLLLGKAREIGGFAEDMAGRRLEVTSFATKGSRFELSLQGFAGAQAGEAVLSGYLLTHTRDAVVGTLKAGGGTYGFYGVKHKADAGRPPAALAAPGAKPAPGSR